MIARGKPDSVGLMILIIFVLGFSRVFFGQAVNATLLGTVTDTGGAIVVDARVTAIQAATGSVHQPATNGSGITHFRTCNPTRLRKKFSEPDQNRKTGPLSDCFGCMVRAFNSRLAAPAPEYTLRMVFAKRLREGVRRGEITCSVRIWIRPHVPWAPDIAWKKAKSK